MKRQQRVWSRIIHQKDPIKQLNIAGAGRVLTQTIFCWAISGDISGSLDR